MTILRLHGWWWPSYSSAEANFWGWRHCVTIGPALILWGLMTEAELIEDARRYGK